MGADQGAFVRVCVISVVASDVGCVVSFICAGRPSQFFSGRKFSHTPPRVSPPGLFGSNQVG